MSAFLDWLADHPELLGAAGLVSVATFLLSLVGLPLAVAGLPHDYFAGPEPPRGRFRHPVLRLALRIAKNALGCVLLVAGLAMLVLPGQGVLTLVVAALLLDFPGKRRLELALVRRRTLRRALDWLRARAGRPAFRIWDPDGSGGQGAAGRGEPVPEPPRRGGEGTGDPREPRRGAVGSGGRNARTSGVRRREDPTT